MIALLSCLALARPPLELHASPGAKVIALPRTSEVFAELGLYENHELVAEDVRNWRAPGLIRADVAHVTGGITFVVVELERPDLDLEVHGPEAGRWTVEIVRRSVQPVQPGAILTAAELLAGVPRRPAVLSADKLRPLGGDAVGYGLAPASIPLPQHFELDSAPEWEEVEAWRRELTTVSGSAALPLLWRLGSAHRELGYAREAVYYYGRIAAIDDTARAHLARADAAVAVERWGLVREECTLALDRGATEASILPCLGVLSLAQSDPPPAETGRALAAVAERPLDRLIAGILLERDGYFEEALPLLKEAAETVPEGSRPAAFVALGDAHFMLGGLEDARAAYLATPLGALDNLVAARRLMASMEADGARRWPAWIPKLTLLADAKGPGAPDALYLLAQIHSRFGDRGGEAEALTALWDMTPRVVASGIPAALLAACGARVGQIDAAGGREAELIATWNACWRDDLRPWVVDVTPMATASEAWERLGFLKEASVVQAKLIEILASREREDPRAYLRLAHLRTATGAAEESTEIVQYAQRLEPSKEVAGQLDLELGRALRVLGRSDEAVLALDRAATVEEIHAIASIQAALVELEHLHCSEGVKRAAPWLVEPPEGVTPGDLELLSARCRDMLGDAKGALADAALALARAPDETTKTEARWLATAIANRTGELLEEPMRSDAAPWVDLRAEEERHATFQAAIDAWMAGTGAPPP